MVAPKRELQFDSLTGVETVAVEDISNEILDEYKQNTFLGYEGWNGFWDLTLKRHLYFYLMMEQFDLDEAIHIETDVVPYLELDMVFDKLKDVYGGKLLFTSYTDFQLSAHFLCCGARQTLKKYCDSVVDYLIFGEDWFKKHCPGEVIIAENHFAYKFWKDNPDLVDLMPTMPDEPHFDRLGFLIDPQGYGMWLSGVRESPGRPYAAGTHHIGRRIIDMQYDILFSHDHYGNKSIPFLHDRKTNMVHPIAAIHFNSKVPEPWI